MWRMLLTRRAGKAGTKKLIREYGSDLSCVRYRYDEEAQERVKTVEIVVERVRWPGRRRRADAERVDVRLTDDEDLLRRANLFVGGRWSEETDTWELPRATALSLGLKQRVLRRLPGRSENAPAPDPNETIQVKIVIISRDQHDR